MKNILSILSPIFLGVVFGILSTYLILYGLEYIIVLWLSLSILIGFFIEDSKYVKRSGILFGFFLVASFLLYNFWASGDKIFAFTLLILVLSLVGVFLCWGLVFISNFVKIKFFKKINL